MRDLIDKKNKLYRNSTKLKTLKFINELKRNQAIVTQLIKEQDDQYKLWYFYKEYIKAIEKERKR